MRKIAIKLAVAALALTALAGCTTDADVASRNLSQEADNFGIVRRIVFINGITDQYLLEITGRCSITDANRQLEVTCKIGEGQFKKHFLGLSDNVTYLAEQVDGANVSTSFYKVTFKPTTIVPDVELR
jgi:hypothetical protein